MFNVYTAVFEDIRGVLFKYIFNRSFPAIPLIYDCSFPISDLRV